MAGKQHCGALESAAFWFCGRQVKLTNGKLTWEYCRPCVNPGAVDSGKPLAADRSSRGKRSPRYRYRVFVCIYRICMEFLGGRRPFFAEGDPRPVVQYKKIKNDVERKGNITMERPVSRNRFSRAYYGCR